MSDVTRQLARFIVNSRWGSIPQDMRHEAKRALLNWLGCALGGCHDAAVETALAALREFSGPPQAALLGRRERLDILNAALLNNAGWHITATCGVFGTAAACGKLLQLSEQQMTWALGIAATQSSGLTEMLGSLERPLSDTDLETKFRALAEWGFSTCNAFDVIELIWSFDNIRDAAALARTTVLSAAAAARAAH